MDASLQSELIKQFAVECHDRGSEIDPDNERDWLSLTLGWALAKGLTPSQAHDFALHIRYQTNLG